MFKNKKGVENMGKTKTSKQPKKIWWGGGSIEMKNTLIDIKKMNKLKSSYS